MTWARCFATNTLDEEREDAARDRRLSMRAKMARAAEPHKPKNREFENRSTHQGAIVSIRRGLDEMIPLTRDVPNSSPALCVTQIHGRMLAMRAAGRRPFMGKHPIKHKSKEKPRVVSDAGAHRLSRPRWTVPCSGLLHAVPHTPLTPLPRPDSIAFVACLARHRGQ